MYSILRKPAHCIFSHLTKNMNERVDFMKKEVPIWEKQNLTVEEAAALYGVGEGRIRSLLKEPGCKFVLFVGTKTLVKRKLFDEFLSTVTYL